MVGGTEEEADMEGVAAFRGVVAVSVFPAEVIPEVVGVVAAEARVVVA